MPSPTTERSVVEVLRAAKERISVESHRCTGASARDRFGEAVLPDHPRAASWSPVGAVIAEGNLGAYDLLEDAYRALFPARTLSFEIDDSLSQQSVLAVFDRAIELAEAEQP